MRLIFCCGSKSQNIPFSGLYEALAAVKSFFGALVLVKDKITFHCCDFWFYMRYFSYFSVKEEHRLQGKISVDSNGFYAPKPYKVSLETQPKVKVCQAFLQVALPAPEVPPPVPLVCSCSVPCFRSPRSLCQPSYGKNSVVSPNQMGPLARSHRELLCWERVRAGGWVCAGALGWAHFRVVLPLTDVYRAPSLAVSQMGLPYLTRYCKFVNKPNTLFTCVQGRSEGMKLRQCWLRVNFSAAIAPAHQCLHPLGMTIYDFVFPQRVFSPACFSAPPPAHIPWPNMDQHTVTWCAADPLNPPLQSSSQDVKRGAVASRSQAPMRWEDFILLRTKISLPLPKVFWTARRNMSSSTTVEHPGRSQT